MNLGGTVRISRCGMLSLFGFCAVIIIYYMATNHQVKGSLAHTLKNQLQFNKKPQDNYVDLTRLLSVAIAVAERGGNEVKQVHRDSQLNLHSKGKTQEGVENPVTDGDMRSHHQMYYGLKKMFPRLTVISEEHHHSASRDDILPLSDRNAEVEAMEVTELDDLVPLEEVTVWIDPLDATKEYSENKLEYVTTMACIAVRGEPVAGVVHQPFKQEAGLTYWAWAGHGHSKTLPVGGRPQFTSSRLPDPLKVLVSMSHTGNNETELFAVKAFGENTQIVSAAGAGYKTLGLMTGLGDVYLHTTRIKKWDTCAPNALLRATGGRMTTLKGDTINYAAKETDKGEIIEDGLLAATSFHKELLEKVKKAKQA